MATIRIVLGIICLTAFGWSGLFSGGAVGRPKSLGHIKQVVAAGKPLHFFAKNAAAYSVKNGLGLKMEEVILSIASKEIGVREQTGHNDGNRVEAYLRYAGGKKGDPWCAAFVSWVFGQAGYAQPRTVWSPAIFPHDKLRHEPARGLVFGIYFPSLKRISHCGFVEKKQGDWLLTIEGNTNIAGSREGDGVYRKWRPVRTIRYFADWQNRKEGRSWKD